MYGVLGWSTTVCGSMIHGERVIRVGPGWIRPAAARHRGRRFSDASPEACSAIQRDAAPGTHSLILDLDPQGGAIGQFAGNLEMAMPGGAFDVQPGLHRTGSVFDTHPGPDRFDRRFAVDDDVDHEFAAGHQVPAPNTIHHQGSDHELPEFCSFPVAMMMAVGIRGMIVVMVVSIVTMVVGVSIVAVVMRMPMVMGAIGVIVA